MVTDNSKITMIQHNFTTYSLRSLINLKTDLQGTLKNERNQPLFVPTKDSIAEIDSELFNRGYLPLKIEKK